MRTPNTQCLLCSKPLYRRPSDMAQSRYAACMNCRSDAQKASGITDSQRAGLILGRAPGTNHRSGYQHKPESKAKSSLANKAFWLANPNLAINRAAAFRGESHYRWNGGVAKLNTSIRQMRENRKWMDAVKQRDGHRCTRCGSTDDLECHHKTDLAQLIVENGVTNRAAARLCVALWDTANGETLCQKCHYSEHGRLFREAA